MRSRQKELQVSAVLGRTGKFHWADQVGDRASVALGFGMVMWRRLRSQSLSMGDLDGVLVQMIEEAAAKEEQSRKSLVL